MDILTNEDVVDTFLTAKLGTINEFGDYEFSEYESRVYVTSLRIVLEPKEKFTEEQIAKDALIMKGILQVIGHLSPAPGPLKRILIDREMQHQMFNPNATGSIDIPIDEVDASKLVVKRDIAILRFISDDVLPIRFHTDRHATRFSYAVSLARNKQVTSRWFPAAL